MVVTTAGALKALLYHLTDDSKNSIFVCGFVHENMAQFLRLPCECSLKMGVSTIRIRFEQALTMGDEVVGHGNTLVRGDVGEDDVWM